MYGVCPAKGYMGEYMEMNWGLIVWGLLYAGIRCFRRKFIPITEYQRKRNKDNEIETGMVIGMYGLEATQEYYCPWS